MNEYNTGIDTTCCCGYHRYYIIVVLMRILCNLTSKIMFNLLN